MARYMTLRWESDPTAYGSRKNRLSFTYQAFVPDSISQTAIVLTGETATRVSLAESEINSLNGGVTKGGLEAVAPLLLRAESVASSRIEGLELSQRNLARALFDPSKARSTAKLVAGNVQAMDAAIAIGEVDRDLCVADITDIHRTLLHGTEDDAIAGEVRSVQNWLGGQLDSPLDAEFVPPPPGEVPALLEDLVAFVNRQDMPAVVQAAIAHAQFETIHPFEDGNGRVGRCLIHVILRRRGLAPRFVSPVSVVLAANSTAYIRGLTDYREGRVDTWCGSFAYACRSAAEESGHLAQRIALLQDAWRGRAGHPRIDSAAARIIELLPSQPIVSVATASALIGSSDEAARNGIDRLAGAGVLRKITQGRYARAWSADELFELLNEYEHGLATPTRADQPRRPAPHGDRG